MLNKVMIIGRLGRDPELRYTQSGMPVATLNVATDESFTDRDGNRQEKTEWHRIVVFQRQAENCANFLTKGSLVYVEGSLQTRKWQDQQGQDRYTTEIKGQRVQFLDRKGERQPADGDNGGAGGQRMKKGKETAGNEGFDDWGPYGNAGKANNARSKNNDDEDLGPAFPSEASSMDDMVF